MLRIAWDDFAFGLCVGLILAIMIVLISRPDPTPTVTTSNYVATLGTQLVVCEVTDQQDHKKYNCVSASGGTMR